MKNYDRFSSIARAEALKLKPIYIQDFYMWPEHAGVIELIHIISANCTQHSTFLVCLRYIYIYICKIETAVIYIYTQYIYLHAQVALIPSTSERVTRAGVHLLLLFSYVKYFVCVDVCGVSWSRLSMACFDGRVICEGGKIITDAVRMLNFALVHLVWRDASPKTNTGAVFSKVLILCT